MKLTNIVWAVALFFLTVVIINIGLHAAWSVNHRAPDSAPADIFQILAASIIITWILLVIAYYIWAIRFYCINLGWTDPYRATKSSKLPPSAEDISKAATLNIDSVELDISNATSVNINTVKPKKNPHQDQSLGLPEGTVRATIALSMLVAGLSMTIASLSMNNTFPLNALFIDHYDFFKTGFLMMIAFYFGTKSLDILRKTKSGITTPNGDSATAKTNPTVTTDVEDVTNPNSNSDRLSPANPFMDHNARG